MTTIASRYASRFRCVGPECEETCCGGWTLPVDAEHYVQIEDLLAKQRVDRKAHPVVARPGPAGQHGRLVLEANGLCFFMDEQRLCKLQTEKGELALPDGCASFPRKVLEVSGRRELGLTLACPEAARLCLLAADAVDLVPLPNPHIVGAVPTRIGAALGEPYFRYFDVLRGLALEILQRPALDVTTKLFATAFFASKLDGWLVRSSRTANEMQLAQLIALFGDPALFAQMQNEVKSISIDEEPIAVRFLHTILLARFGKETHERYARLIDAVWRSYAGQGLPIDENANALTSAKVEIDNYVVWRGYRAKRDAWSHAFAPRIEQYFRNYLAYRWLTEPYTKDASLSIYVAKLTVRYALLRFLFFGHAALQEAEALLANVAEPAAKAELENALDGAIVDVVQSFDRYFEHDVTFMQLFNARVSETVTSVADAMPFVLM